MYDFFIHSSVCGHLGCFHALAIVYSATLNIWVGFPGGSDGEESRRLGFSPWVGRIPWRREWPPTPVFLPGESRGQRILVGYSPWGHKALDMTEQQSRNIGVHVSFSIMFFSGYMASSGITGSYGSFIPSFLGNLHTVLHSSCIDVHSH